MNPLSEKEIMDFYMAHLAVTLSGDVAAYLSLFIEDTMIIGSTEEEWMEGIEAIEHHYRRISDQIVGKIEIRNRTVNMVPLAELYLVTERNEVYVNIKEEWVFFSKTRMSTLIGRKDEQLKIFHQHVSVADQSTVSGETLPYQKLKREYNILKEAVRKRTHELEMSLANLKATQVQLIHSEKMASLGELTAGIAHEIQNPLNFVNNFSQVSNELLEEMKEELDSGHQSEVLALMTLLSQNLGKIQHHGERASNIVKGMLQHARLNGGEKEPTDINALCDEYLRLAFHGMRAKDRSFNVDLQTDFDPDLEIINVVSQEIGRVVLNLITNAFHACAERKAEEGTDYQPVIWLSTRRENKKVQINVRDNGKGIPAEISDKIFQPFFTTKPTGQGTGLGLSLSYDIVKAHHGSLEVESVEGEGTKFKVTLPFQ